ncbi:hypothetical protein A0H81_10294 [Grifola frondosa]|uniref:Uncharacterized protein n=1 Tax=Grifola frondosa TaxID=5627 RepID=A0A1C7M019_GRIFR|nr:hypothetical protein A0H81_10294 [Grifola frondosa]
MAAQSARNRRQRRLASELQAIAKSRYMSKRRWNIPRRNREICTFAVSKRPVDGHCTRETASLRPRTFNTRRQCVHVAIHVREDLVTWDES